MTLELKKGTGTSLSVAAENVNFNMPVKYDATRAYASALAKNPLLNIQEFAKDYLKSKVKDTPNVGCSITLEPAKSNSRTRPYTLESVATTKKRHFVMTYQLVNVATSEILAEVTSSKSRAENLAKELITNSDGKIEKIKARVIKTVDEGEAVAFNITFTPSIGTKEGSFILFGYNQI